MKNSIQKAEEILIELNDKKGFLTEDEIIDVCIELDLDLVEIDVMCERLLNKKMLFSDNITSVNDSDEIVDRSQYDYDALYVLLAQENPNCRHLIEEIQCIMPPQTREWITLVNQAQQGNQYAKERIISMYLRTVLKMAYEFSKNYYTDFEDAFQYGVMGLITAIEKYDITSPDSFVSYFPLWVRQYMQRYCEIRGTIYRFPAHYKERLFRLVSELTYYIEDDNIEDSISLIPREYLEKADSYYKEIIADLLPGEELQEDMIDKVDCFAEIEYKELSLFVDQALSMIKEKEKDVIVKRFGIGDNADMTLEEVGIEFGVTRERIRQIETKALQHLRHPSCTRKLKDFLD